MSHTREEQIALMGVVAQEVVTEAVQAVPEEVRQEMAVSEVVVPEKVVSPAVVPPLVASKMVRQAMAVPEVVVPEEVVSAAVVPQPTWQLAAEAAGWIAPATPAKKRERPGSSEDEVNGQQPSRLASLMGRFWYCPVLPHAWK